ncbi:MAG: sulfurtransferase [Deltaproteobacteria bacterium]|nr:sulfurtransferase [Deltaproteobacteria bacterium]
MEKQYSRETLLIDAATLRNKLGAADLCIIDTRPAEDYAKGHIPGATHFDLFGLSLADTSDAPLKAFMFMIHHVLELRGVSETKEVVFYEENSGMRAARGLWFLEYYGHPNVKILDGGMQAWRAGGAPVTTDGAAPKASTFKTAERREVLATADDVLRALDEKDTVILDTRSAGEHFGTTVRAARGGAIPRSILIEWTDNLNAEGKFKSNQELKAMYDKAGITPEKEVYAYCQGGYRAAHGYIALRLLGYPKVRNYIGSWKEWGDRTDLPLEVPTKK